MFIYFCLIVTLHTPSCIIFYLLYVHNITYLSSCSVNCSNVASGKSILNTSIGIQLLSLPVSILYSVFALFDIPLVSNFVIY